MNTKRIGLEGWLRQFPLFAALGGVIAGSFVDLGCTPGMFSNQGADSSVMQTTTYRRVNSACAGMNLESNQIDVATFRAIIKCFNTYHALDEIDELFNGPEGLKDHEIQPIVNNLNRFILDDKKRLFEIENTYNALVSKGIFEDSLEQMGRLLQNEDFITSGIALLEDGFFSKAPGSSLEALIPDPDLLKSLEEISNVLTPDKILQALELGILLSESRPFQDLLISFRRPNRQGKSIDAIVGEFHRYFTEPHVYPCGDRTLGGRPESVSARAGSGNFTRDIKSDLLDYVFLSDPSRPFDLFDQIIGSDPDEIRRKVPKLSALFNEMLRDSNGAYEGSPGAQPSLFTGLLGAFHALRGPIACMKQGASVPSGTRHLIYQLANLKSEVPAPEYVLKSGRLDLMALVPFCDYPAGMNEHYQNLVELAQMGLTTRDSGTESGMITMADLLTKIHEPQVKWGGCPYSTQRERSGELYHPLTTYLSNVMGEGAGVGFSHWVPLLADLATRTTGPEVPDERNALSNLLLITSLIDDSGRLMLVNALKFMATPRSSVANKTLLDVFLDSISRQKSAKLVNFAASLEKFADLKEEFLGKSLRTLRQAYFVNQVHPILNLVQETLAVASQNGDFYGALYLVSQKPKFKDSIRLLVAMSRKDDGRLKSLFGSIISLFHKFAEQGRTVILPNVEPLFTRVPRHSLAQSDLLGVSADRNSIDPESQLKISQACLKMNLNASIADSADQLQLFLQCQGDPRVIDAGNLLIKKDTQRGGTFHSLFVKMITDLTSYSDSGAPDLAMDRSDLTYLTNQYLDPNQFTQLTRFLDLGKLFIMPPSGILGGTSTAGPAFSDPASGDLTSTSDSLPILDPLLEITQKILNQAPDDFRKMGNFAADQLKESHFPSLLTRSEKFLKKVEAIIDKRKVLVRRDERNRDVLDLQVFTPELREQTRAKIREYECVSEDKVEARVDEIIAEAKNSVSVTELMTPVQVDPSHSVQTPGSLPSSVPIQEWDFSRLKPFADLVVKKLSDPTQSNDKRRLLDAFFNVSRRFALDPELEQSNTSGVKAFYPPEYFGEWLYQLSRDYQPIVIYPHGCLEVIQSADGGLTCKPGKYSVSNSPRVVLYNSLKRLELILYEVAFPGLGGKDLGLDFPLELAESWGDVPEGDRFSDLKAKAKGQKARTTLCGSVEKPCTVEMAVQGIIGRANPLENRISLKRVVGYPKKPSCLKSQPKEVSRLIFLADQSAKPTEVPSESIVVQRHDGQWTAFYQSEGHLAEKKLNLNAHPYFRRFDGRKREISAYLYLNDSDSEVVDYVASQCGLIYWSSGLGPELVPNFVSDSLSYLLPSWGPSWASWFNNSVKDTSDGLIDYLLKQLVAPAPGTDSEASKARIFNMNQVYHVLVEQSVRPDKNKKIPAGLEVMRDVFAELFFSSSNPVLTSDKPSTLGNSNNLTFVALMVRTGLLTQLGQFVQYFDADDPDLKDFFRSLVEFLVSKQTQDLAIEFFKRNPQKSPGESALALADMALGSSSWDRLRSNFEAIVDSDPYRELTSGDSARLLLDFLELEEDQPTEAARASKKVRHYLARRLRSEIGPDSRLAPSDVEEILYLAKVDPEGFKNALRTLSVYIGEKNQGRLKDFMVMLKESLSESKY